MPRFTWSDYAKWWLEEYASYGEYASDLSEECLDCAAAAMVQAYIAGELLNASSN